MNIGVPSRFACLKIEDDDTPPRPKETKKKPDRNNLKKFEKGNKDQGPKKNVSKQSNGKKEKKKNVSQKQWEDWKKKDNALVDDQFEGDLQSAILLSKLDYEEKKSTYEAIEKTETKKGVNKKKKNKAIPLDEFLNKKINNGNDNSNGTKEEIPKDEKFFENITLEAQEELNKEKIIEQRKERDANIEERITIAQYQEKLEKEQQKNMELLQEVKTLKEELKTVKSRNKALCDMLGHGEMKDKADVLVELEKLKCVRDELTEEVTRLHGLLEQEKSKVTSLTDINKHKDKKNKKHV